MQQSQMLPSLHPTRGVVLPVSREECLCYIRICVPHMCVFFECHFMFSHDSVFILVYHIMCNSNMDVFLLVWRWSFFLMARIHQIWSTLVRILQCWIRLKVQQNLRRKWFPLGNTCEFQGTFRGKNKNIYIYIYTHTNTKFEETLRQVCNTAKKSRVATTSHRWAKFIMGHLAKKRFGRLFSWCFAGANSSSRRESRLYLDG